MSAVQKCRAKSAGSDAVCPSSKTRVVLTIDTEPDDAWSDHLNPSVANVRELLRLQDLLDRFGARATCLVTYRVIQDDAAVDVLRTLAERGAEIGAHLHPWETPPFLQNGRDVKYHTYPHELPRDSFEQKLTVLTKAISNHFAHPTSYRAGRWGLAAEHIGALENLGYVVDTSVSPWIDWRPNLGIPIEERGAGGIDYRRAPLRPYHPDYSDAIRPGGARLLEIPVTVGFTRRVTGIIRRSYGSIPVLMQRVLRKSGMLRPVWALPAQEDEERLVRMTASELAGRCPAFNIAFHSSELMRGGSPRTRTLEQVDGVFRRIERLLETLAASGQCTFETLTGLADQCLNDNAAQRKRVAATF